MYQDTHDVARSTLAAIITAQPGGSLAAFIAGHRAEIDAHLAVEGAVMFRGFGICDPGRFRQAVLDLCGEPWRYTEGSSERRQLGEAIYTST